MSPMAKNPRLILPPLLALGIIAVLYAFSQPPQISSTELQQLVDRFQFKKVPFPKLADEHYKNRKQVRDVHPTVHHIRSWMSFVGAAVTIADIDNSGLANDLVYVETRINEVIVCPAPGSKSDYKPFALNLSAVSFDAAKMAPTGTLVGDFNEDGLPDILVYFWGRSPIVFLQQSITKESEPTPLSQESFVARDLVSPYQRWYTSSATQADLDGDGHVDLLLGNYYQDGSKLLDAKAEDGQAHLPHSLSRAYNGGKNRLFLWDVSQAGEKTAGFREVPDIMEDTVARGWTLAVGTADLNGDMLPEIYWVQDFGPDRLLLNQSTPGNLKFSLLHGTRTWDMPRSKVLGQDTFNGMGIDFCDLNGDQQLDIFVSNITCNYGLHQSSFVFLSEGKKRPIEDGIIHYQDASEELGLARGGWAWEMRVADFDNDSVPEVTQATGFLKGEINRFPEVHESLLGNDEIITYPIIFHPSGPGDDVAGWEHNPFFVRASDGRYYDIAPHHKVLKESMLSRGIATSDTDGDGKLDFAVANNWETSFFFRNQSRTDHAFLGLHLRLPIDDKQHKETTIHFGHPNSEDPPTRPAFGALAMVFRGDGSTPLIAQVDGGNGHSGKRSPDLHFGLGSLSENQTLRVELRWRGGDGIVRSHTIEDLEPGWHTILLENAS